MDNYDYESIWKQRFYKLLEISSKKIADLRYENENLVSSLENSTNKNRCMKLRVQNNIDFEDITN